MKLRIEQVKKEQRQTKDLMVLITRGGQIVNNLPLSTIASGGNTTRETALLALVNSLEKGETIMLYIGEVK